MKIYTRRTTGTVTGTGDVWTLYSNPPAEDGEDVVKYVRLCRAQSTEEGQGEARLLP